MNTNLRRVDADGTQKLERVRVELDSIDGDVCRHFTAAGPVEVLIVADAQPPEAAGRDGMRIGVWALRFPNYPIARARAAGLSHALAQLERAIGRALEAADKEIPTRDDGHQHVARFVRFSRTLPQLAICECCMEVLVDDVNEWARSRGLMPYNDPTTTHTAEFDKNTGTIKDAIEKAFNQDGGTDG